MFAKHNYAMVLDFWNRSLELAKIKSCLRKGGFGYVTGRRRVGKTALLRKANETLGGIYHQAVEGTSQQQLLHLTEEIREQLPIFRDITPRTWPEFFHLLSKEKLPGLIIFDEFSYWIDGDPHLPSILQKWIDHELPKLKTFVLVSGSSQSMLYSHLLSHSSPLYGRASFHLHLEPMSYYWFCRALNYHADNPTSFARFALVGGVPHYWKLMPKESLIKQVDFLYFEPSAILSEEPIRLVRDEGITGALPKAILDLVGRGISKPSELAARLGTAHGNLSRPLALLLDLDLIHRELPFGESPRTTKKVLYSIQDPALSFYYSSFLVFRERWRHFGLKEKEAILNQHVSRQWENFCRQACPGSKRYWEGGIEIDVVYNPKRRKHPLIAECKWAQLSSNQEKALLKDLQERFHKTQLSRKLGRVDFRIFSKKDLPLLKKMMRQTLT